MKKLGILALAMALLLTMASGAYACETAGPIKAMGAKENSAAYGESWWAITTGMKVAGKISPEESAGINAGAGVCGAAVQGITENGILREKSAIRYTEGERIVGLSRLKVGVTIETQYLETVKAIIFRRLGEETALCANSVISATLWWEGSTVCHIFYSNAAARVRVGAVMIEGAACPAELYMGDFDGDGERELGFAPGWVQVNDCGKEPEKPGNCKPPKPPVYQESNNYWYVTEYTERWANNECYAQEEISAWTYEEHCHGYQGPCRPCGGNTTIIINNNTIINNTYITNTYTNNTTVVYQGQSSGKKCR